MDFACNFENFDQLLICNNISSVKEGFWLNELKRVYIEAEYVGNSTTDVLLEQKMLQASFVLERRCMIWNVV